MVILALLVAAPAAQASRCGRATTFGEVVAKSSESVVFTRDDRAYGCYERTGKVRRLPVGGGEIELIGEGEPQVAGRFTAYVVKSTDDKRASVVVYDLKRGKRSLSEAAASGGGSVLGLVLRRDGTVAWVGFFQDGTSQRGRYGDVEVDLVRHGRGGPEMLDYAYWTAGYPQPIESLQLTGDRRRLTWRRVGEDRSAPLD